MFTAVYIDLKKEILPVNKPIRGSRLSFLPCAVVVLACSPNKFYLFKLSLCICNYSKSRVTK